MGANSNLRYDSDIFQTTIDQYREAKDKFEATKKVLTDCIESLRQGWQTDAGDAFFANFDDDLSPALDKYINFMDYLIESLEAAKNKYDTVVDKAEALRY